MKNPREPQCRLTLSDLRSEKKAPRGQDRQRQVVDVPKGSLVLVEMSSQPGPSATRSQRRSNIHVRTLPKIEASSAAA